MPVYFRPCKPEDAAVAVPLLFESGPKAFRYVFSNDSYNEALDFLHYVFVREDSQFSYQHHMAIEVDDQIIGVGASWQHKDNFRFMLAALKSIIAFYGLLVGFSVIIRGLKIESVMLPPAKEVVAIGHIAVQFEVRGKGYGARLMNYVIERAKQTGLPLAGLDVAETNPGAKMLYERLGFIEKRFTKKELVTDYGEVVGHSYMELSLGS